MNLAKLRSGTSTGCATSVSSVLEFRTEVSVRVRSS